MINKVHHEYAQQFGITRAHVKGIVDMYLEKAFEQMAHDEVFHMQGYLSLKRSMTKFKPRRLGRRPLDGRHVMFQEKPSVLQLKCTVKKKGVGITRRKYASLVARLFPQHPLGVPPPPLPPPPPQPVVEVAPSADDDSDGDDNSSSQCMG